MGFYENIDELTAIVKKQAPKKLADKGMPVNDPPIGDYEIGCLGRYERVRIDIATSEPALYTRYAEALEKLAMAFRTAAKKPLPSPSEEAFYKHERLMTILALDRQVDGVRRYLTDLWKKQKRSRSS